MVGPAVQLRALSAEVPVGQPVRPLVTEATPPPLVAKGRDALV